MLGLALKSNSVKIEGYSASWKEEFLNEKCIPTHYIHAEPIGGFDF